MNLLNLERAVHFPKKRTGDLLIFSFLAWVGFVIFVGALTFAIDRFSEIDNSIWESAAQLIPWFVLFIGVHTGGTLLPINIAHGTTRRDFAIESVLFLIVYSVGIGLLMTIGWVLERALFAVGDWPQTLSETHLFSSATDYPRIFVESFLLVLGWTTSGFFIAAAYYRYDSQGLLAIAPCIVVIGIMQAAMGSSWGPAAALIDRFFDPESPPLLVVIIIGFACVAAIMAMAWPVIRDIPLRSKAA